VFSISRQMLVNDDLGAIDQILGSAGDMVHVFENTTFFQMFNSNPTLLQDSTAVFASGHNNLAGSGAAPSVAGQAREKSAEGGGNEKRFSVSCVGLAMSSAGGIPAGSELAVARAGRTLGASGGGRGG
jgi:hypothetical protein